MRFLDNLEDQIQKFLKFIQIYAIEIPAEPVAKPYSMLFIFKLLNRLFINVIFYFNFQNVVTLWDLWFLPQKCQYRDFLFKFYYSLTKLQICQKIRVNFATKFRRIVINIEIIDYFTFIILVVCKVPIYANIVIKVC